MERSKEQSGELEGRPVRAARVVSMGQIATGVAHAINDPLSIIDVNVSVLLEHLSAVESAFLSLRGRNWLQPDSRSEGSIDEFLLQHDLDLRLRELRQMMVECRGGADRINKIVRDLASLADIETDDLEPVRINDVVEMACRYAMDEIRQRARLVTKLGDVPTIRADRRKLALAIAHLLSNAVQSIDEGLRSNNEVRVSTGLVDGKILIAVEDTGCGISPEVQPHIFEPFFTTKPKEQSSGMGLVMSTEIVRKHGGEVAFTSKVGEGSRFEVILPVQLEVSDAAPSKPEQPASATKRRRRVLVIDDEPGVVSAFRRMLEREHDVVTAVGGPQALAVLERDAAFDVVICDLMMPSVDGTAVYNAMLETRPDLARRFVFCTGGAFTARARQFLASSGRVWIEKPVQWGALMAIIDRVCVEEEAAR